MHHQKTLTRFRRSKPNNELLVLKTVELWTVESISLQKSLVHGMEKKILQIIGQHS